MAAVTVEALLSAPCPRAGVSVTGLGVGASVVSVWRIADGERVPVRGARRILMNDAHFVTDYDAPLGRPIRYEVEVLSGPDGPSRVISSAVTVNSGTGWIMDPLVPQSAVPITRRFLSTGQATFAVSALSKLEYAADIQSFKVMGSSRPIALFGQRMAAAGVDFSMITAAAEESSRLRELLQSASQVLVRVPLSWTDALPGSCFTAIASVVESPVDAGMGGVLTLWTLTGDTVAAPTIRVLTASFTYGDVALLMSSYGQKQELMGGKTYLDDLKNPLGG